MTKIKCVCDPRKAERYPSKDKTKNKDGKLVTEWLGYKCIRCGNIIIQVIEYAATGGTKIKWIK